MNTEKFNNSKDIPIENIKEEHVRIKFSELKIEERLRFTGKGKSKFMKLPKLRVDHTQRIIDGRNKDLEYNMEITEGIKEKREYKDNFSPYSSLRIERGPNKGMIVLPPGVKITELNENIIPYGGDLIKCTEEEKHFYQKILKRNKELFNGTGLKE